MAVHAARRLVDAFPHGQLYAELADDDAGVGKTLAYFLRTLGVPPSRVPGRREDAIAAYRTLTADRRLLIVLDGAPDASAVRALLPSSHSCGVIVTSRCSLPELFMSPGAHTVHLQALPAPDAFRVLCEALGHRRVHAEHDAADELLRRCNGSPMAIRSAAAELATRPTLSITSYLDLERPVPAIPLPAEEERRPIAPFREAC